jgi:NAD(P)-dependent dehydrogenase (short-subunit alcohol dehydrogenase family)
MSTQHKLKGGLAVITGAGGGLGSALARHVALLGMKVIVADIAFHKAEAVALKINEAGGQAHAADLDVSDIDALDRFVDFVCETHGHPRLLINNAAIETLGFCWEVPKARWEATLNVNIHGVVHGVRAFLPRMLASKEECWIINICSIGAFVSIPTQTAYLMTKHAIQAFTEGLYLELQFEHPNIHVSSACPGLLRTEIFEKTASNVPADEDDRRSRYQQYLASMAQSHGMEVDQAAEKILSQAYDGKFWVWTHEDQAQQFLRHRSSFLSGQTMPSCPSGARHMFNFDAES